MKRLMSMLLAIMLVISFLPTVGMAEETSAFTDVKGTEYYADAALVLSKLSILKGYEDNSFGAEKTITRAEMAAVICRMLDKEADAEKAKGETKFDDVKAEHWASGYVNAASNEGIINGYFDNTFKPENEVLFEEAVKMVVCALGLDEDIKVDPDDWSKAYLDKAKENKVTDNLKGEKGKVINRGDVAVMVKQALSFDLVAPVASVAAGTYSSTRKVTLTTATKDAEIYYTTDGSEPTAKSTKYEKEISISKTTTLKAVTVKNGVLLSDATAVEYVIKASSGGGGGGGGSSKKTIKFDLNYPGATGAPNAQKVKSGEYAVEPEEPQRDLYIFGGWYTEKECINEYDFSLPVKSTRTLYAAWYSTDYSIYNVKIDNNLVLATIATGEACNAIVTVYNEEQTEVLGKVTNAVDAELDYEEIEVDISEITLPEYYVIAVDLCDEEENKLCATYYNIEKTTAYEEFMAKTIHDFEGERILNFDEQEDMNFGVLSDEVEEITVSEEINTIDKENSDMENYIYEFDNADDELKNLQPGDIVYFDYGDGCIITVESIVVDGDTVVVTSSEDSELQDYFSYIKVEMTLDPEDYEEIELPVYTDEEESGDNAELMAELVDIDAKTSLSFRLPIEFYIENKAETVTGKLSGSVGFEMTPSLEIKWDAKWCSKDYFKFALTTEIKVKTDVFFGVEIENDGNDMTGKEFKKLEKKIPLSNWIIPFGVSGLNAKVDVKVPLSVEFKGGLKFNGVLTSKSGVSFDTINGTRTIKEKNFERELTLSGEMEVSLGIEVSESIQFLDGVLKGTVSQGAGAYLQIEADLSIHDETTGESDHVCTFCAEGELGLYLKVEASLSYKVTSFIKGTPISGTLYDARWKLIECYYSSEKGFGWGECPNLLWRTKYSAIDTNFNEVTDVTFDVLNEENETVKSDISEGQLVYLANGKYIAIAKRNGASVGSAEFVIDSDAEDVLVVLDADMGTLSGYVANAEDRTQYIAGASIEVYKNNELKADSYSNSRGNYSIDLAEGNYVLVVSAENYIPFECNVSIIPNEIHYEETLLLVEGDENEEGSIDGVVTNSVTGSVIPNVTIEVYGGWNRTEEDTDLITTTSTNEQGSYELTLPLGNYTLKLIKERYVTDTVNVAVTKNNNYKRNATLVPEDSEEIPEGDLRIVLTWGEEPSDLDSHLVGPAVEEGTKFHTWYGNENYTYGEELKAYLDWDDTTSYGPETTTVYKSNESGVYRFFVHDYTNRYDENSYYMSNSGAQVKVFAGEELIAIYNVPANTIGNLWTVFEFDSETRTLTAINSMTTTYSDGSDVGLFSLDDLQADIETILESVELVEKESSIEE